MTGPSTEPRTTGRRLLVISGVRWGYLWQRHQALATAAAADGWLVDFLEPHPRRAMQVVRYVLGRIRRTSEPSTARVPADGIRVLPPSAWLRRSDRYDLVLCYVPDRWSERRIRAAGGTLVYDAVLDWATVPAGWYRPIGWRASERRIAARAVASITDAPGMQEVLRSRGIAASVVPPAADDAFLQAPDRAPDPGTAVYFGAVRDEVDVDVLVGLAGAGVRVTVIGTLERPAVGAALEAAGVEVRPPLSVEPLAAEVSRHELVLLPYRGARAATIVPAKLWNCLASGRWVLATGLRLPVTAPNLITVPPADAVGTALRLLETGSPPPGGTPPRWSERWAEIRSLAEG